MQIINWLQVFCSHLCKWLLLPFITASFSTCLSISSSWCCQNNISLLLWLWSDGAQMKVQAEERTQELRGLSGVWCWIWGAWHSLAFWHFWKMLWKVPNTTHCSCAAQMETVSKKSETRTSLKLFAHLLLYLQVHRVKRMVGSLEIQHHWTQCFPHTPGMEPRPSWDLTLTDPRVFWQPHTCTAGPCFTKSSYSISLLCESEAFIHKIPYAKYFHVCAQKAMGATWLPGLSALCSEHFL